MQTRPESFDFVFHKQRSISAFINSVWISATNSADVLLDCKEKGQAMQTSFLLPSAELACIPPLHADTPRVE